MENHVVIVVVLDCVKMLVQLIVKPLVPLLVGDLAIGAALQVAQKVVEADAALAVQVVVQLAYLLE